MEEGSRNGKSAQGPGKSHRPSSGSALSDPGPPPSNGVRMGDVGDSRWQEHQTRGWWRLPRCAAPSLNLQPPSCPQADTTPLLFSNYATKNQEHTGLGKYFNGLSGVNGRASEPVPWKGACGPKLGLWIPDLPWGNYYIFFLGTKEKS